MRVPDIVVAAPGKELNGRKSSYTAFVCLARIPGVAEALLVPDELHPRIALGITLENLDTVVMGPVVNSDNAEVTK